MKAPRNPSSCHITYYQTMGKSFLYTGTGDSGMTSLVGGERVSKDSLRLEAYGTVDEFSSHLGLLRALPDTPADIRDILGKIQNDLFVIGAYLATPAGKEAPLKGIDPSFLEKEIDRIDSLLEPMRCFILPGGTQAASQTHIARTVCRRAERRIITLAGAEPVDTLVIKYFNRLSDLLFALARYFNRLAGVEDTPWHSEK